MLLLIALASASVNDPPRYSTCYDAQGVDAGDASPETIATRLEVQGLLESDEDALHRSLSIYEHMVLVADDEATAQDARFSVSNLCRRLAR
ncbi:MAG: hypothetical protein GY913_24105 [Proteobacteria bacterium]|nr:hypothetical protein [Pseudomonadota bacterium]